VSDVPASGVLLSGVLLSGVLLSGVLLSGVPVFRRAGPPVRLASGALPFRRTGVRRAGGRRSERPTENVGRDRQTAGPRREARVRRGTENPDQVDRRVCLRSVEPFVVSVIVTVSVLPSYVMTT